MTDFSIEDEIQYLNLLRFALDKKSVDPGIFYIGTDGSKRFGDEKINLVKTLDNSWHVFLADRGNVIELAEHQSLYRACKDFYCRLISCPSPWDFRSEMEATLSR